MNAWNSNTNASYPVVSPVDLQSVMRQVYASDRFFTFPRFQQTAAYLKQEMEAMGLQHVEVVEAPADGSTHWTTRSLARRLGIGKDAVAGIWSDHSLKPWRIDTFEPPRVS